MQRFLTSLVLILALGMGAGRATALGFGKVTAAPMLGQPLSFAIALRLEANESIESSCVRAEVSFGDRLLPASMVRSRVETSSSTGERQIRVATTVPVDEPIVNIELHAGCTASLSRSFLVFADPPRQGAVASGDEQAQEAWVPERVGSSVSPVLAAVPPSAAASAPTDRQVARPSRKSRAAPAVPDVPGRSSVAASANAAVPGAPTATRARRAAEAPKPSRGPVLRLDPVEVDSLISPSLQMATSLSQAPEPAASGAVPRFVDPEQEQRFRDQERLQAMEATLLKLRNDSQATEKALNDMQLRVRAAEAGRYANPLVYLLLVLCILLAAGLGAMWWLRRRDRRAAAWWSPPVEAGSLAPEAPEDPASEPMPPRGETIVVPASPKPEPRPMFMPPPLAAPSRPADFDAGGNLVEAEPRRPMSAEELIDLEQQAEFFVVLGQDDAAIDLLMGHVRSTGGVSPLPYLKLLEIYRRRGEREPYDRIRERFNRRFNAYAPEWDVDPELGLSLEGYPDVMGRLQKAWAAPSQAMDLLDAALFRRDAGPTFDVPAYRELLFLYSLSRDLAERDTPADGVDLLLPLGDDDSAAATFTSVPATPAKPAADPEQAAFTLDLDVSTGQPPLLSIDLAEDPAVKRKLR